ncbi:hypothetical protein [Tabrizicola sp.]|uniref:hypothetical protein n=1 Tax=Tabrizicola sp. TaxID=2005166 RepID=UPI003F2AFD22
MWASDTMRLAALCLAVIPLTAKAETPMTGAEFEAHVGTGTVVYSYNSGDTGTADYGPGRTLRWAFAGDACFNGYWFEQGDELCFAFEDGRLSACWHFYKDGDRIYGQATVRSSGNPEDLQIFEVSRSDQPLACPGSDVGV